jgi:hypothetical protein
MAATANKEGKANKTPGRGGLYFVARVFSNHHIPRFC